MLYTLEMTFVCSNGESVKLSIDDVKSDLTESDIVTLMDTIIENNAFYVKYGPFVEKSKALITERTEKIYNFTE